MSDQKSDFDGIQLVPGVRVFDYTEAPDCERLERSSGTISACSNSYQEDAIVPLTPWHSLHEGDLVFAPGPRPRFKLGSSIGVIPVPHGLIRSICSRNPFEDVSVVENDLLEFAGSLNVDPQVETCLRGVNTNKPGLTTTTFNPETSKYIGLHLDSFYGHSLEERHLAPNRLCLNIGVENRFLVFINLTLIEMHELLLKHAGPNTSYTWNAASVGDVFMRRFPNYPVIKLLVQPGEAYIAPTENIIHDGTTAGKHMPDIFVTFLGAFAPAESNALASGFKKVT